MYSELYLYLVLHKQLTVPGIGTFQLERRPADIDFANKVVNPPAYVVALHHGQVSPSIRLYGWLARVMNISERDAVIRFNDFVFDLKDQIQSGKKMQWEGLGTLSKGLAGEIRFEPSAKEQLAGEPVPAVKVLRENAQHTVRVGEDERTSSEMIEILNPVRAKKSYLRIAAIILAVLALLFIIWHFFNNGLQASSSANQQKLTPQKEISTHKPLS